MNLEDLVGDEGLQQDEWSLTRPTFGKDNQLTVTGWSGRCHKNKYYILKCLKCSQDIELFGEACFRSTRGDLVKGKIPCGCAFNPRWSKEQHFVRCSRKAKELGYTFLGFEGEWRYNATKIKMSCDSHGEWTTGSISGLISCKNGCPECGLDNTINSRIKPDEVMIQSFLLSGVFDPNTKFWRSERRNKAGYSPYWTLYCPQCDSIADSTSTDLQKGHRPCLCSPMRQRECYINLIQDVFENTIAIKFGIANNSKHRIKNQDRLSAYTIKQHSVYTFSSVQQCKQAERECKKELETGVVLKRDMPDGYTETTWAYNLDKIIEIYERNGGVRQENP